MFHSLLTPTRGFDGLELLVLTTTTTLKPLISVGGGLMFHVSIVFSIIVINQQYSKLIKISKTSV